jgi:hypothetical protein
MLSENEFAKISAQYNYDAYEADKNIRMNLIDLQFMEF